MCRIEKDTLKETAVMAMTTSTIPPAKSISSSNSFFAVSTVATATSASGPSIQCFDLPSCNSAFSLNPPKSSGFLQNGSSKDYFESQSKQTISKLILCGNETNVDAILDGGSSSPPTHLVSQHTFTSNENAFDDSTQNNIPKDAILVWDTQTSQLLHKIQPPQDSFLNDIATCTFNNTPLLLALVYIPLIQKYQVLEYDVQSGKLLRKIRAGSGSGSEESHSTKAGRVSCSPDGNAVAVTTGTHSGSIKILNRLTGKKIKKISLFDSSQSNGQDDTSFLMRFSSNNNFLMVSHENTLDVFPVSKASKSQKVTLLMDSQVQQRTSIVNMDMITIEEDNLSHVLITCADGTVCLFHNVQTSLDKSNNISISVTTTIQGGHGSKQAVHKNGTKNSSSYLQETKSNTAKLFFASFSGNQSILLITTSGSEENGSIKIGSQSLMYENPKSGFCLGKEEWISMVNHSVRKESRPKENGEQLKRKINDSIALGPDKTGSEFALMETMEQIRKAKKIKLGSNAKNDALNTKEDEESIPVMIRKNLGKQQQQSILRLSTEDRLFFLSRNVHDVYPSTLPPYKSSSTKGSAMTKEDLNKKLNSIMKGLHDNNMTESAKEIMQLLIDALAEEPSHKEGRVSMTTTMFKTIINRVNNFPLISEIVGQFQAKSELYPHLLDQILFLSQGDVGPKINRKIYSFWSKRILMELMYKDEESVGNVVSGVKNMIDGRLANSKNLHMLEGRIGHIKESLTMKVSEGDHSDID